MEFPAVPVKPIVYFYPCEGAYCIDPHAKPTVIQGDGVIVPDPGICENGRYIILDSNTGEGKCTICGRNWLPGDVVFYEV